MHELLKRPPTSPTAAFDADGNLSRGRAIVGFAPGFFAGLVVLWVCAGCSSLPSWTGLSGPRAGGKKLTNADFVAAPGAPGPNGTGARVDRAAPAPAPTIRLDDRHVLGEVAASKGLHDDLQTTPGPPVPGPRPAITLARSEPIIAAGVLVDAKVGDVNGKAIYASSLLEPMAARLLAEASRLKRDDWRRFAGREIARELEAKIGDELLRAEALASLTPEQKQGFLAYVESLQKDFQRRTGGTRSTAERALASSEGITLDEWRQRRTDEELIKFQLEQRITRRVNVVSRDLEQRYEQMYEEYNRPPIANFRLVQVRKDNAGNVRAMKDRLASGEDFALLAASSLNTNKRAEGGLEKRELKGPRTEQDFFPNEALNQAARTVAPGAVAGPIELSTTLAWIGLESIEERAMSYYDAQLELDARIRQERVQRERRKYMGLLQNKASMTSFQGMVVRLMVIAESWYYEQGAAMPPQPRASRPPDAAR